jgi:hypothetical protein
MHSYAQNGTFRDLPATVIAQLSATSHTLGSVVALRVDQPKICLNVSIYCFYRALRHSDVPP